MMTEHKDDDRAGKGGWGGKGDDREGGQRRSRETMAEQRDDNRPGGFGNDGSRE